MFQRAAVYVVLPPSLPYNRNKRHRAAEVPYTDEINANAQRDVLLLYVTRLQLARGIAEI